MYKAVLRSDPRNIWAANGIGESHKTLKQFVSKREMKVKICLFDPRGCWGKNGKDMARLCVKHLHIFLQVAFAMWRYP